MYLFDLFSISVRDFCLTNCCIHKGHKNEWHSRDPERFVKWRKFWEIVSSRSKVDSPMLECNASNPTMIWDVEKNLSKSPSNLTTSISLYTVSGMRTRPEAVGRRAMTVFCYLNKLPHSMELKCRATSQRDYNHTDFLFYIIYTFIVFFHYCLSPLYPCPTTIATLLSVFTSLFPFCSIPLFPNWHPRAVSLLSIYESVSVFLVSSVYLLDSTYEWNHMVSVFFWLAYFTQHNVLQVHPCCRKG